MAAWMILGLAVFVVSAVAWGQRLATLTLQEVVRLAKQERVSFQQEVALVRDLARLERDAWAKERTELMERVLDGYSNHGVRKHEKEMADVDAAKAIAEARVFGQRVPIMDPAEEIRRQAAEAEAEGVRLVP